MEADMKQVIDLQVESATCFMSASSPSRATQAQDHHAKCLRSCMPARHMSAGCMSCIWVQVSIRHVHMVKDARLTVS